MATVFIPTQIRDLTGGQIEFDLPGNTVGELIDALSVQFPEVRGRLIESGTLRRNLSVAVDGEISPLGLLEKVKPTSEVHFVAAIRGGAAI